MSDTGSGGLPPAGTIDNSVQNTLLVGGGLALLALAAAFGLEICLFCGPPEMETIQVSIDKACTKRIDAQRTATQRDRDVLVWRVENECPTAREVLICVDPKNGEPPLRCVGDPPNAEFGTPFQIDAAQTDKVRSYIICAVKWPAQER